MLTLLLAGCASLYGLTELDGVPPDFPLPVETEVGHVTALGDRQIALDLVYPNEEAAREAWMKLRKTATNRGFERTGKGKRRKREFATFEGERGKVELACCAQRADRNWLVFVTWWKPET